MQNFANVGPKKMHNLTDNCVRILDVLTRIKSTKLVKGT